MGAMFHRRDIIWRVIAAIGLFWTAILFGYVAYTNLIIRGPSGFFSDPFSLFSTFATAILIIAAIGQTIRPNFRLVIFAIAFATICYFWIALDAGITLGQKETSEYVKVNPLDTPDKIKYSVFEVVAIFATFFSPSILAIWFNWPVKVSPIENEFT